MFNGKMKALTFSYDDGVKQDVRLIEILNKYNLKCTLNINSELLGTPNTLLLEGKEIAHDKVAPEDVKYIYDGHEVAVHTLTHPRLTQHEADFITHQVEQDRLNLSELCGYEVIGMAYPCGDVNNDDRVAEVIKNTTGVKFARTITTTDNFDLQDNLYRFNPSVYHMDFDKMFELGEKFLALDAKEPQIFYIWGHSYEFDIHNTYDKFEEFCQMISGKSDIFYGTNKEILLAK